MSVGAPRVRRRRRPDSADTGWPIDELAEEHARLHRVSDGLTDEEGVNPDVGARWAARERGMYE